MRIGPKTLIKSEEKRDIKIPYFVNKKQMTKKIDSSMCFYLH